MKTYSKEYKRFVNEYLKRDWNPDDGLQENEVIKCETKLGFKLPKSLRELYLTIGKTDQLLTIYNKLLSPSVIEIEENYLVFMDENQSVVSWGVPLEEIHDQNPIIWQRNNTEKTWYSEEQILVDLLRSMFNWYDEMEIFNEIKG